MSLESIQNWQNVDDVKLIPIDKLVFVSDGKNVSWGYHRHNFSVKNGWDESLSFPASAIKVICYDDITMWAPFDKTIAVEFGWIAPKHYQEG